MSTAADTAEEQKPRWQPIPAIELAAFKRTADPVIARLDLLKSGDLALLE